MTKALETSNVRAKQSFNPLATNISLLGVTYARVDDVSIPLAVVTFDLLKHSSLRCLGSSLDRYVSCPLACAAVVPLIYKTRASHFCMLSQLNTTTAAYVLKESHLMKTLRTRHVLRSLTLVEWQLASMLTYPTWQSGLPTDHALTNRFCGCL